MGYSTKRKLGSLLISLLLAVVQYVPFFSILTPNYAFAGPSLPPLPTECPGVIGDYTVIPGGTAGNNTLNGTSENDLIFGYGGADTIFGNGGDDCIVSGDGNDTITTQGGNDVILAGGGANHINAGAGDNHIITGNGNDTVTVGDGNDTISAGGGANDIIAGEGYNLITTGDGNDTITTGSGNYPIDAGGGANDITVGNGNHNIYTGDGNDTIIAGDGNYTVDAGGGANDITVGNGNHNIYTEGGNDTINTGNGDDQIRAGGGANHINAGGGTDLVITGNGNDNIDGGPGFDVCVPGGGSNTVLNCESGDEEDYNADTVSPTVPVIFDPDNGSFRTTANLPKVDWHDSTDVAGSYPVEYQYESYYNSAYTSLAYSSGWLSASEIPTLGTSEGTYYLRVRARDAVGNISAWSNGAGDPYLVTVDNTAPTADLIFPTPGTSSNYFNVVFSEAVKEIEAENTANYFLSNWPGAGGSGSLTGHATITYDDPSHTATITFITPGWYISPEQHWGVKNIPDLAGNLLADTWEYSTPMVNPSAPGTPVSSPNPTKNTSQLWSWVSAIDPGGVNASGVKGYYYSLTGSALLDWTWLGNSLSLSTSLLEGSYQFSVKAEDNAGNQGSPVTSDTLVVDTTAPVTTLNALVPNPISDSTPTFTGESNDGLTGISLVEYKILNSDSSAVVVDWTTSEVSPSDGAFDGVSEDFSITPFVLADGNYTIYVRATDKAGNVESTASQPFTIDTTAPTVPGQIGWTSENPPVGSDYIGGVDFDNYRTCGGALNYSPMTNLWGPSIDSFGAVGYEREVYSPESTPIYSSVRNVNYENGGGAVDGTTYWVRVRAHDAAGNYSDWTSKCSITYDTTDPVVALTSPTGALLSGTVAIRGSVTDANPDHYWLVIQGPSGYLSASQVGATSGINYDVVNESSSFTDKFFFNWDTTAVSDGVYTIKLEARDAANNKSDLGGVSYAWKTVTVDNTAPAVTWNSPVNGDAVSGSSTILDASASDLWLTGSVTYYYKTTGADDSTLTLISSPWDLGPISLGYYTLVAQASDLAGNLGESRIDIEIKAVVSNEATTGIGTDSFTVTWTTDKPTTSRVVYDIVSHPVLGVVPDYGYAYSTATFNIDPGKVTSHSVTITGLNSGTTYYFRTVSSGSPTTVGEELSVRTGAVSAAETENNGEVLGASLLPDTGTGVLNLAFASLAFAAGVLLRRKYRSSRSH